jgi:hypothetical protein
MGGFHLYSLPDGTPPLAYPRELSIPYKFVLPPGDSSDLGTAEHPLEFKYLTVDDHVLTFHGATQREIVHGCKADYNALAYFAPTETEIKDKGKADVLAKILVILQTSWFVAQCIARGVKSLPLTGLEVVTLAYATMSVFIYCFWWDKPKDVGSPVRVYKASKAHRVETGRKREWECGMTGIFYRIWAYVIGVQDHFFKLDEESQTPMFWSGKPGETIEARSMIGASIFGMMFGAIHLIAWNSEFPSHIELLLWRISCVAVTVFPLTVTVICGIQEMKIGGAIAFLIALTLPLTGLLYISARIATLVTVFTTLRALPSDAFKTVDWATFIPHL